MNHPAGVMTVRSAGVLATQIIYDHGHFCDRIWSVFRAGTRTFRRYGSPWFA